MCFSPEVDFAVGTAIAVVGIDALRHCPSPRYLPLAAMPMLFAAHSFSSALVWCGFLTDQPEWITAWATSFYVIFAFVVLPLLVPVSILAIEWNTSRRWWLVSVTAMGLVAALDFGQSIARGDTQASQCTNYIDFNVYGSGLRTGVLYVLATCAAMMLSQNRNLQIWGGINFVAVSLLGVTQNQGLPSLWCFLAAATSFVIAIYLRVETKLIKIE
ncbi:MAG: hypothetical protein RIS75_1111 [Actinomycetota bacterium]